MFYNAIYKSSGPVRFCLELFSYHTAGEKLGQKISKLLEINSIDADQLDRRLSRVMSTVKGITTTIALANICAVFYTMPRLHENFAISLYLNLLSGINEIINYDLNENEVEGSFITMSSPGMAVSSFCFFLSSVYCSLHDARTVASESEQNNDF